MDRNFFRKLNTIVSVFLLFGCGVLNAQVTIGSNLNPNSDALLDMKQGADNLSYKGMLLPRVMLEGTNSKAPLSAHVAGMFVYNMKNDSNGSDGTDGVYEGIYYNDGTRWVRVVEGPKWFYMPSFNLPMDAESYPATKTFPLYDEYVRQFAGSTSFVSSNSALTSLTPLYPVGQLDFVVTDYDPSVITVDGIDADGILHYTALTADISQRAYINIILVIK